ncbi:MerR family transcriptional regulator [Mycobacteroides abscessus]|uniref:heavy metal-responsive transcriptional regulator n=1 Tax=Mycobacteroides abscessus TaxID=36809 RepID=UPI0005E5F61C|nr:heavy metal-responsive transcriptional regulator [Mycobacteroides abscessus]CPY29087.1 MerR family transcriptional regulator [Mycobacteroides abscessus]
MAEVLIGELARAADLLPQTIRFYEQCGLLPAPRRSANGYRSYDRAALTRLRFIRAGQSAGLTLHDIASIVDLRERGTSPCAHVHTLLSSKLEDITQRQQELAALATELRRLLDRSRDLDPVNCTDAHPCHILSEDP